MSRQAAAHTTPVHARELLDYLACRGAVLVNQAGSHLRLRLPNGAVVTVVDRQEHVSAVVLRNIALKLGMSYPALRETLGHPIQAKGKPRAKCATPTPKTSTKADVRRAAAALRDELRHIETDATGRDRDPSVYARAHRTILAALKALNGYRNADAAIRRTAR